MKRYVLTNAAIEDLDNIWDYSAEVWSVDQADKYVGEIRAVCEAIARGDATGRPADEIRAGYRKAAVRSHILFFHTSGDGTIEIVRILHQRMDISLHL
ncbi:MAG: type II toxin-antitoxin system RelE/ParE family toxin [Hyphomonadaceae bacterium]|nr:type II toxin-antitoxin system RelE/ParE family toxin [Hyphomonadaceae bacterium]